MTMTVEPTEKYPSTAGRWARTGGSDGVPRVFSALIASFLCVAMCPLPTGAASPQESPRVGYREGRLSVTAEGAPLCDVLRGVAGATGVDIKGIEALGEPVTISLESVPLHEGLQRLLARVSYILLEESAGGQAVRPTRVRVFPTTSASFDSTPVIVQQARPSVEVPPHPPVLSAEVTEKGASPYGKVLFSEEKSDNEEGATE